MATNTKSATILLAATLLLGAPLALAADQVQFQTWSSRDGCEGRPKDIWKEKSWEVSAWKSTSKTMSCATTSIKLNDWPQTGEGKYKMWVNTGKIEDGCQLIFFDAGMIPENERTCNTPFKTLPANDGCRDLLLPKRYGAVHCCGDVCEKAQPGLPTASRKREASVPRDVTLVKRGSPLTSTKRGNCEFKKTGDAKTEYGPPKQVGDTIDCPERGGDCGWDDSYQAGLSVSTSTSESNSVGGSAGASAFFFSVSASYGHTWTKEKSKGTTTVSTTNNKITLPAGKKGALLATPILLCGKGKFEGSDCDKVARDRGDGTWCIPKLSGEDGNAKPSVQWSVYEM